jgi:hypothetical protein
VLWVLIDCLLVVRESELGATCEISSNPIHAYDRSDNPPMLLYQQVLRLADYPSLKGGSDLSLFRWIGEGRRARIGLGCLPRAKIGVKICSSWEPYITTRRPRGQSLWALGRTQAKPYYTDELGWLLLSVVATGPRQCETKRKSRKRFLFVQRQLICPIHMH